MNNVNIVSFDVAKKLKETFPNSLYEFGFCDHIYTIDTQELIPWESYKADFYLKDSNSYYIAPYIWHIINYLEDKHKWSIYITPRFDGFDNAQIDTYFEIYKTGKAGGHDYSSDAHVGSRYESSNRAIIEVCNLIINEKNQNK